MKKNQEQQYEIREIRTPQIRRSDRVEYVVGVRDQDVTYAQGRIMLNDLSAAIPEATFRLETIKCKADRLSLSPLHSFSDLSVFSDGLDRALLDGSIDIAIQSLHELPDTDDSRFAVAALTPREDARDLIVMPPHRSIENLKPGDRIGYFSQRQKMLFSQLVPNLQYRYTTGSVLPRLERLVHGELDGLLLSAIDIIRLNPDQYDLIYQPISLDLMCPPSGRGIVAIRVLARRRGLINKIKVKLDSPSSRACYAVEQAIFEALGKPFDAPVGIHCEEAEDSLYLRAINGLGDPLQPLKISGKVGPPFSLIPNPDRILMYVQSLTGMATLLGNARDKWLTDYGKTCIQQADVIVTDSTRCEHMQLYQPDDAEWIQLNPADGFNLAHQDEKKEVIDFILEKVRAGRRVVRLYGDNIDFFDKGYEEADVLATTGIRYELVPGVSELSSALTILGVPLLPKQGQAVHIVDGRDKSKSESSLINMNVKDMYCIVHATLSLPNIIAAMKRNPIIEDVPAVMLSDVGTFSQKMIRGKLSEMPRLSVAANMPLHAMLLFGDMFRPGAALAWWPPRGPLSGKRVGVIAAKLTEEKRHVFNQCITALGGTLHLLEGMYTRMDGELAENMDRRLRNLFDKKLEARGLIWFALMSVNGAKALTASLQRLRMDYRKLTKVRLAALNPAITDQLERSGLAADLVAEGGDSRKLGESLLKQLNSRDQLVVVRGGRQTSVLAMMFQLANISYIDVRGYETIPIQIDRVRLLKMLAEIDILVFTTAASVNTFLRTIIDKGIEVNELMRREIKIIAQGPNTADTLEKHGLTVDGYSKDGSITELINYLSDYGYSTGRESETI
ncbi:MAG TPA: hypothetical protein GX717_02545 [Clostridiaceae bacterium]|nr:hypothetical protein [Clostridiaceae bacterium]